VQGANLAMQDGAEHGRAIAAPRSWMAMMNDE
jgi:hypothetical protein